MIYKKLFDIQKMGLSITKNGENTFFKKPGGGASKYVTLDAIRDVFQPILCEKNILCIHGTENNNVVTVLLDLDDDSKVSSYFPLIQDNNPQKHGSCITYAKRYNLGQLLNIMTDEDDDGNKASVASVAKKQQFTEKNFENLRAKKDQFKTAKEMISKAREIYEVSDVFIIQIENLYDPIPGIYPIPGL